MSRDDYYLAAATRELDRLAIEEHGIAGFTLMQRAGHAAFQALLDKWPDTRQVTCFCGGGNNGGDGYVIAALARAAGLKARVIAVGDPRKLRGDAKLALDMARDAGVEIIEFRDVDQDDAPMDAAGTVIVDALLGTGLTGPARDDYASAIALVNRAGCPVLAVDIPSGLSSDTGERLGPCVEADLTVTFIGRKLGQVVADGPACCGELVFDDLDVPPAIYERVAPAPLPTPR